MNRTAGVESDLKRMQGMYKGLGLTSEDSTKGGGVESDISRLQKRNEGLRKATQPVRQGIKKGGRSYWSSAIDFARNLLLSRKTKLK